MDRDGLDPLYHVTRYDHTEIFRQLLDYGADPNVKGEQGSTALLIAAQNSNIEVAKLLIDAGADVSATDDEDNGALHFARTANMVAFISGDSVDIPKEVSLDGLW